MHRMDPSSTGQVTSPNRLSKTVVNFFLQELPTMKGKTRTYLALATKLVRTVRVCISAVYGDVCKIVPKFGTTMDEQLGEIK